MPHEGRAINQTVQATIWVQTNPIPKLKDPLIFDCATCPGVVAFYKDFVELLYEFLEAIGHTSHTKKNWDRGRLFSLEEQIDHKMDFIKQELENIEVPIILVGHSVGSYISIDMFRRSLEKMLGVSMDWVYCCANPVLPKSNWTRPKGGPMLLVFEFRSRVLSVALSLVVASLGFLPSWTLRLIVKNSVGKSWSATAVEATCSHLVQVKFYP
uniref:Uncharacterized protein n=1 Tax=Fagus sylvatica TaxID=28930 RepID=A0A2N9IRF0_FAGSY